ncbi:MAG TPA: MBL fold metallo-hydrolase [Rhizomicrobium sp.]|nr:MBL fold metallo-hydrolase [Rhizomicrobium sp.]
MAKSFPLWRDLLLAFSVAVIVLLTLAAVFAPYVNTELSPFLSSHMIVDPAPAKLAKGRMVDDYFAVQDLGDGVFAIGEPRYYQQNYAYLILGNKRALLFDSSSGTRDVSPVVASLTRLPVTVMVSHLHFDHLGGIAPFHHIAMIDLPGTRADVTDGMFTPGRYEFGGLADKRVRPSFQVSEWIKPGAFIDLGGRRLQVLSTPGHTPSSVSLYDAPGKRLFTGDYIYPTTIYAFGPGASRGAYHATAERLLATIPPDTILWTAHCCRADEGISAPWLTMNDLRDLDDAFVKVSKGEVTSTGFYPRRFPVSHQMTLATGFSWTNR